MIDCHYSTLWESHDGPAVAISFRGFYPSGSLGNEHAELMRDYVSQVVAQVNPAAVLFDLTDLDYEWGDAICTMVLPLRTKDKTFRPFCLIAVGPTAVALRPLFTANFIFGAFGGKLFENRQDGVAHLMSQVESG
jgi:hypothetical protein